MSHRLFYPKSLIIFLPAGAVPTQPARRHSWMFRAILGTPVSLFPFGLPLSQPPKRVPLSHVPRLCVFCFSRFAARASVRRVAGGVAVGGLQRRRRSAGLAPVAAGSEVRRVLELFRRTAGFRGRRKFLLKILAKGIGPLIVYDWPTLHFEQLG